MKHSRKKNVIPPERLQQLKSNVVYEVRCGTPDCECHTPETGCYRGFFSLFIQAANGIAFSKRFHLPYFINFGHITYAYSEPGNPDRNFWNYYFEQPIKNAGNIEILTNERIETYPLRIWDRDYIRGVAKALWKELIFKDEVAKIFDSLKIKFQSQRVLGVHIRATDHPNEIAPVKISDYVRQIDNRISHFDKIFLATDDFAIATQFKEKYGDQLWLNEVTRSINGEALHLDSMRTNRYQLGLEALVDCYSLSLCTEVILTQSNLSYSVLLFNPELKYKLLERPQTRMKKLLTLTLYYLDKWNIRKW